MDDDRGSLHAFDLDLDLALDLETDFDIDLIDLGYAMQETRQYQPDVMYPDSIFGLGWRPG